MKHKKGYIMKRFLTVLFMMTACVFLLVGCGDSNKTSSPNYSGSSNKTSSETSNSSDATASDTISSSESTAQTNANTEVTKMNIQIGNAHFTATLEDNAAVRELIEMMRNKPITIKMNDYSGFEKVGSLGRSLPTDNHQTTTSAGDIVLYNGNQIVMFYGSNSWSYTRIGRIDDLSGWEKALGSGSITAVFSL